MRFLLFILLLSIMYEAPNDGRLAAKYGTNVPPIVDAGYNQTITMPLSAVNLSGSATDTDGRITRYAWALISGPTIPRLYSSSSPASLLVDLMPGIYRMRLTVSDNLGASGFDEVEIVVNQPEQYNTRIFPIAGSGEYQTFFIDKMRKLWGVGNVGNIGTNNTGVNGVVQPVQVSPSNLQFKYACATLHGGAAVDIYGRVHTMGDNTQGEHGIGNNASTYAATRILTDSAGNPFDNIVNIVAFFTGNAALGYYAIKDSAGIRSLWGWGNLADGFRGNGTDSIGADYSVFRPVKIPLPAGKVIQDIKAGVIAVALFTDGTVATLGKASSPNLGYAPTTSKDYQSFRVLSGITGATKIAGGGPMNYAVTPSGLKGWGFNGKWLGNSNGLPISTPTTLTNIQNGLPAGQTITDISTNSVATHVIVSPAKQVYGWGNYARGTIGNGEQGFFTPLYAWNFDKDSFNQILPDTVMSGVQIERISFGVTYTFSTCLTAVVTLPNGVTDSVFYCFGNNKGNPLPLQIVSPTPDLTALRPDSWNRPYPTLVNPFGSTGNKVYVSTCPTCITSPSVFPCKGYVIPVNIAPVPDAGPDVTTNATSLYLDGSASTDNVYISYYIWSQLSGPNNAIFKTNGNPWTPIYNLIPGTYVFNLKTIDNGWLEANDQVQVTITDNSPRNIIRIQNGSRIKFTTP